MADSDRNSYAVSWRGSLPSPSLMTIEEDTEGVQDMSEQQLNELLYGEDAQSPIKDRVAYWESRHNGSADSPTLGSFSNLVRTPPPAATAKTINAADADLDRASIEMKPMHTSAQDARRQSVFSEAISESTIAESLLPPPLLIRKTAPPPRHHSRRASTAASRRFSNPQSIPEVQEPSLSYPIISRHPRPSSLPIQSPPRTRSPSIISGFSPTPSEIPYLGYIVRSNTADGLSKAERMLGLQSPPREPSIEAQDSPVDDTSDSSALEPTNGRTAWLHVLTGTFIIFNCWGMANAFGLFQAYYVSVYLPEGTNPSNVSWIGSTQLALVFGLGAPVGWLVDKGYFRLMFHGGSVVMLLGIFCTAWCKALWSLWLVQGLITGLGMGMVFGSGMVALMTWFDEKRLGTAMALGAVGSCIGGIVYVLMARSLLISLGFATTMRIVGGLATVTTIPANLVFRIRGQHQQSAAQRDAARSSLSWSDFTAPAYLLAAAGMFFAFLGVYFGFVYMISFAATELQLSARKSTDLLIYMLVANIPGRLLPGMISDRCIGPMNTMIPGIFLSAACIILWISVGGRPQAWMAVTVIACFYGFTSASVQSLYAPAVYAFCLEPSTADSSGREKDAKQLAVNRLGAKSGVIFTCIGVACFIGTPIGGALISYRTARNLPHPYLGAQVFAMCSLLLGGFLLLASRVSRIGWEAKRA